MSMPPELQAVLDEAKAHDKFIEFLRTNDMLTMEKIGLMASTESVFEEKTLSMLKAAGVPTDGLADIVS